MKRSMDRIVTTHVGRLQRPDDITAAMEAHPRGQPTDAAFAAKLSSAVTEVVRKQAEQGVDIVNDGKFGKLGWNTYINGRLGGHEHVSVKPGEGTGRRSRGREQFAAFYKELEGSGSHYYKSPGADTPKGTRWACTGPVKYIGQEALRQDLANLAAALAPVTAALAPVTAALAPVTQVEAFIPATSPIRPYLNRYYASEEKYFEAVGEAMREEYLAIVGAGFVLQIDDPHLPDLWDSFTPAISVPEYLKIAEQRIELVNHALRGIPEDRVRYHICWGSWHGPHVHDLPMKDVVQVLLKVRAQGYSIEAANARHEHEWEVWKDVKLPEGKVLIPGVVAHATNVVEHPELVARRIANFAAVAGRENVIASTDCGLGYRVHPQIAWAKLATLAEGARLATRALWGK
ncbi:MAG: hypothetical protein EXR27_17555 [Betaproteobacteria bacterium]|nr:hypothetical protein [Betaproteobacteria bacterium]